MPLLSEYNSERFGPLLGVSDEGSAADDIAAAAVASAKALAANASSPDVVGLIIDGERMTSAGEVPIGPDEYARILQASRGQTYYSTNVGVRLNARMHHPLPEFAIEKARDDRSAWLEAVFAYFRRFLETPDRVPRPLTVRLIVPAGDDAEFLRDLVGSLEAGRRAGRMAGADVHRLSLLVDVHHEGATDRQVERIMWIVNLARELGVPEVAVDGDLLEAARRRLGVQGLLNVLPPAVAQALLAHAARKNVSLVYRYGMDPESAARTVWTGLYAADMHEFSGAKYGLFPLTLSEQRSVIRMVQGWVQGITAIPAFYADMPLVTDTDVLLSDRSQAALRQWIEVAGESGAGVVLVDCPDRVVPRIDIPGRETPRRLITADDRRSDNGIFTIDEIREVVAFAARKNVKVLWSGGISAALAFELGGLGVFGIFTTSSTAVQIPVGDVLASDLQLPAESEPTSQGVRRVHGLLQAGFLAARLGNADAESLGAIANKLIVANQSDSRVVEECLKELNEILVRGWLKHWGASA